MPSSARSRGEHHEHSASAIATSAARPITIPAVELVQAAEPAVYEILLGLKAHRDTARLQQVGVSLFD
jgi:hypothetical protein